jgi:hypothetical protein
MPNEIGSEQPEKPQEEAKNKMKEVFEKKGVELGAKGGTPEVTQKEPIKPEEIGQWSKGYPEIPVTNRESGVIIAAVKEAFLKAHDAPNNIMKHRDSGKVISADGHEYVLLIDEFHNPHERLFRDSKEQPKEKPKDDSLVKAEVDKALSEVEELKSNDAMAKAVRGLAKPLPKNHADLWLSTEQDGYKYMLIRDDSKSGSDPYRIFKGKPA